MYIFELSHILSLEVMIFNENPLEIFHEGTMKTFLTQNINKRKFISFDIYNLKCDCNTEWVQRINTEIEVDFFNIGNTLHNLSSFLTLYDSLNMCTLNITRTG